MAQETLGLGVIGCGGFGLFALQHFMQVPGVRLIGIAGTHREAADRVADRFGAKHLDTIAELVEHPDVNLVYISTPPFLHYEQAMTALEAGKHVICEKPLALTLEQADALLSLARSNDLLIVANLMQRYNPLYEAVRSLIHMQPLGELLHGYFENYASDEGLPEEHWFWDRTKSGGIFIEHGVHFFDMFEGWAGTGEAVAAQCTMRPGTVIEEQVQCTVRYGPTVLVNYYHGFHQAARMDRQELRLLFERGDITLYEWIPTIMHMRAIAGETDMRTMMELFPGARLDITSSSSSPQYRSAMARHKSLDVSHLFELHYGEGKQKMHLYGELLRAMLQDQLQWINDRSHERKVTEVNSYNSLAVAVAADRLAHEGASVIGQ